jgi:hypothetical protein
MFEAGISPEGFRGNGAGPAQVVQAVRAGVDTYVARFNQRAKFLPEELPVSEKLKIIKRNIRPYYQNKIWDNEVNSIDRLLDLCPPGAEAGKVFLVLTQQSSLEKLSRSEIGQVRKKRLYRSNVPLRKIPGRLRKTPDEDR